MSRFRALEGRHLSSINKPFKDIIQRLGSYKEEQKRKVFTQRWGIDFLPMCAPKYLFAWTHPEMYHLNCYFFCNSLQSNAWNRGQSALSECCPTNIVAYTIPNSLLTALSSPGIKNMPQQICYAIFQLWVRARPSREQRKLIHKSIKICQAWSNYGWKNLCEISLNSGYIKPFFPRNMYHVLSRFGKRWWSV